jgi:hypothetical protein
MSAICMSACAGRAKGIGFSLDWPTLGLPLMDNSCFRRKKKHGRLGRRMLLLAAQ